MPHSYITHYWSTDGKTLLGGVLTSRSSRWGSKADADTYLQTVKDLNGPHCQGEVVLSKLAPEIFSHCPRTPAQVIGGICFGCGKILTLKDAQNYKEA